MTPRGPQGFSEPLYAYVSQTMNNGSAFATRPVMATGRGTLRTDNPTFVSLVLAVVVIVVLLTFVPALLLGSGVQGFGDRLF